MANAIAYGSKLITGGGSGSGGGGTWTAPVACLANATTCTITDENITTTSTIDVYSECSSGNTISITNVAITAGQAVLTFPALAEATNFKIHILL